MRPPAKTVLAKVLSVGERAPSNARSPDDLTFGLEDVIEPPYDPELLCRIVEQSSSIRPNIEAYATNIESFGFRLEPTLDPKAKEAREKVREAIIVERLLDGESPIPTEEEVTQRLLEVEPLQRLERLKLELFFERCGGAASFIALRKRKRADLETTGNAYWELLRDDAGEVVGIEHLRSVDMRIARADTSFTRVLRKRRVSAISSRRIPEPRRFRRYVQRIQGLTTVWFKELDDPRVMSSRTGRFYATVEDLNAAEDGARPATEVLHFAIYSPSHAVYGVPRWIGATPAVLGARAAEEVNLSYFDEKTIPPLALLVSGGSLSQESLDRISGFFEDKLKGRENFHKMLVLEAAPADTALGDSGKIELRFERLTSEQQKDALFQNYDERSELKIGAQFRLPKILRGDAADVNRATADAALLQAETQVFSGERADDDETINRRILEANGCRFHRFVSKSPVSTDPPVLVKIAVDLVTAGIATPAEVRPIVSEAMNRQFDAGDAAWLRIPPVAASQGFMPSRLEHTSDPAAAAVRARAEDLGAAYTVDELRALMGLEPLGPGRGDKTLAETGQGQSLGEAAKRLIDLRDQLVGANARADESALHEARRAVGEGADEEP